MASHKGDDQVERERDGDYQLDAFTSSPEKQLSLVAALIERRLFG